jgi:hypothetical protein
MIVQDSQTGALHEVPDHLSGYGAYGDQMVYDGLGNPVGRVAGIFDDIGKFVGRAVSAIPGVGPLVSRFLPGGAAGPSLPPSPPLPFPQIPSPIAAGPVPIPSVPMPGFPPAPGLPFQPPWPTGWVRPPVPYTGLGPRRVYMRCAVWPGPRGLVPEFAQNLPPQALPGVPPQALPFMRGRRHRRRHRR